MGRSTHARGSITAQSQLKIRQPTGTASVVKMIMIAQHATLITRESQNRLRIFGTSSQKLDRSTSFFVAPQVMLYEKRCARMACDTGMDSPPKKKKLYRHDQHTRSSSGTQGRDTHKKGTQRMFVKNDVNCEVMPVSSVR